MKFLIDNQLPVQLAVHLRRYGHVCEHVLEIGLDGATDTEVWQSALTNEQVVISKDEDFMFLCLRPGDCGRLVWVRLGNCRNASLFAAFDRAHDEMIRALDAGQRIVEIR